jgi:deoxyribonucleoside regulator
MDAGIVLGKENRYYQHFLMTQVAIMKYKLDYSQKEIAEKLALSPMTISRLIDKAKMIGLVQINVMTPIENDLDMEKQVANRYSLKKAIIFKNKHNEDPVAFVGRAAAYYLDFLIAPNDIIGVSSGRTMAQVIPNLKLPMLENNHNLTVVQTEGGFSTSEVFNPVNILQEFVSNAGVKGYLFNLPVYAKSVQAHEALNAHALLEPITEEWGKINLALSAVGVSGEESIYRIANMLTMAEMNELVAMGAVGSIYGRWYNMQGNFIDSEVNRRVFGIPVDLVKKIPRRILITAGRHKINAIIGGLRTNLCDILITDDSTAEHLL